MPKAHIFTVTMTIDGDTRSCVPLKRELDGWIDAHRGDVSLLPAVKLQRGQPQAALVLRVRWIEVAAESAWEAMTRAAATLADGCPRLVATQLRLTVTAEMQGRPDEHRPPLGA